ncbi:1-aminocyclopropane-1-carboxylate deaminase/D-cysteine desulfhydrase [Acinetobacter sp. ANC 4779]|uniref:1-aminocyclopropane-1-carboxylate deaminase/D-cysteine desulfhydrase n=1 Tax=Acinetobacter sp. ANC 4779 TaxID=2529848 RepID=UPI00104093AA|nr:pyridoxal-phosphate dependent enzyme [Acinetobacter sp. ANC 4779]TCB49562.1 1-aminocyclopropane-1-carboxylate deaminase/D-cysteine desulfhydrase [Acinetobacter sp. ANC 4779]
MFDQIAQSVAYQKLNLDSPVTVTVKRLDQIHPQISGNKFFKLKYNFLKAQQQGLNKVLTFGGAYSNHIAATAYAAHLFGFKSIGIIRGEELAISPLNSTLATAQQFGMQLHFVSREQYRQKDRPEYITELKKQFPDYFLIPEGGTNPLAIQGCKEILTAEDRKNYDVICCGVGTGGTIAGIIEASTAHQSILGFSALKGDFLRRDIQQWTSKKNWQMTDAYCCGGYAKTTPELLHFMQSFEAEYNIPLEQVYTAKMMIGVFDLIEQNYFPKDTRILVIHTGGLQGRLPRQDQS